MIASIFLLIAAAIAFYILAGYPLLLALLKWRNAPAIAKSFEFQPTVSVILAVHNGAAFIHNKLKCLCSLDYPRECVEIIVVSDGSTDATETLVEKCDDPRVRLLRAPRGGKAAALNLGMEHARGDMLFLTDVRQSLESASLRHLMANFADPTVGVVTGEMRLLSGDRGEQADMDLYWTYELWARAKHSSIYSTFNTTGCIYAIRRSLVRPLPADTLTDDAALPLAAYFRGYRIVFEPEAIAYDYPAVAGTEFRRRLRTLAGLWQVYTRFPALVTANHRMRFHFLSHKFSRLLLPWAILGIYASTLVQPSSSWRTLLLTGEALLIVLALVDSLIPRSLVVKRLTSPVRTFFLMSFAALAATLVFFVPANKLWVPTQVTPAAKSDQ